MNDLYPSRCAARPEMLPRLDPVLHAGWTPSAPISSEQAAQFDRDGYLVLTGILTPDEVTSLQS